MGAGGGRTPILSLLISAFGKGRRKEMGEEEKKQDDTKSESDQPSGEKINSGESKDPPPKEIALKVHMHCEGCAKKVKRCLEGFEGVDDVFVDCKNHKVVIRGEKADPVKVLERVQKKIHRMVQLLSPIPAPPPVEEGAKKTEENEAPKVAEEKKEEPQVITVVLRVHMHCEACAQEFKRQILKMNGVENVEPDLKSSQVSVKGSFDPAKLLDHVCKRTGKQAVIVKQETEKKEEEEEQKKTEATSMDKKELGPKEAGKVVEMKKNEFYYYYPNYQIDSQRNTNEVFVYQNYPSQIFSDENPNGCFVM